MVSHEASHEQSPSSQLHSELKQARSQKESPIYIILTQLSGQMLLHSASTLETSKKIYIIKKGRHHFLMARVNLYRAIILLEYYKLNFYRWAILA